MIRNYIQIALRNLWKNISYTLINIAGLAVGMAITLLSLLYVVNELSFDRFHVNKERIYRVVVKVESAVEGTETSSVMTAGIGPSLVREIPEVEAMVRVTNPGSSFFTVKNQNYQVNTVIHADSSFFNVFSFPLLIGNPGKALEQPFAVVLSKSLAIRMFGDIESAAGKIVRLNDRDNYLVTGIMSDPPVNSHLRFDAVGSFLSLYQDTDLHLGWNGGWNYLTYLLIHEGASPKKIEEQIIPIAEENINRMLKDVGVNWNFFLQSLDEVHLNTNVNWDIDTKGSRTRLVLFIAVTFIILVIACINFVNLTTALALSRMKEVGIRKVSGASRNQIILQFLTESMVVSFIALVIAVILIEIFSLWLSHQVSDAIFLENFELYNKSFFQIASSVVFLIVTVGLLAGAYPAYYMSKFRPALAVKGRANLGKRNPLFRNLLVVFQFTISVILIIAALVIGTQLDYLLESDKGFDPRNKIIVSLNSESARNNAETLKNEFLLVPGIEKAGASSDIPGRGFTQNGYFPEGHDKPLMLHALDVDYDFLEAMGIEIVEGRNFSKSFGTDDEAFIINQSLASQLGWDEPVGKIITRGTSHQVIGVVKDFNFSTMHDAIGPLVITLKPWRGYAFITLQSALTHELLMDQLQGKWKNVVPNEDLEAFTLASYIREAYGTEREYMHMLLFCAGLTLLIAALGLFGLAAFITRKRFHEIAVRKVYGAGMNRILVMVSAGFLSWVLLANIIAWPSAYMIMENYFLINFAYNGGINWWIYFAALLFSGLIAFLVIVFQIIRLGRLNPVEYIRYE
jgi:putative ABC transport system permease protein